MDESEFSSPAGQLFKFSVFCSGLHQIPVSLNQNTELYCFDADESIELVVNTSSWIEDTTSTALTATPCGT